MKKEAFFFLQNVISKTNQLHYFMAKLFNVPKVNEVFLFFHFEVYSASNDVLNFFFNFGDFSVDKYLLQIVFSIIILFFLSLMKTPHYFFFD